jgi:DNA-directed RNA polymerase specialized sigma24 family protein/ribosome-associated translation inhibitor RaiA
MNVHISYKLQRTPDIDKEMQHWTAKIQKRLQVFRPELIHLKGLVEQNTPREGTTVSLNLRLPSGQMAVHQSAPNPTAALKAAFDDLLGQIGRHKDLLRNSHRWKRRRAADGRPAPEVPFEETIASLPPSAASGEEIRSYVNANLRRLRLFVERELYLRENSGELDSDSISVEEIVDEAVARALDEKIEKPDLLGLEPWLYRLAIQGMDDVKSHLSASESDVNLQGLRRRRNERASDEPRMQFHQPDEAMTTESGIADTGMATPEEIAYTDEMFTLVQFALGGTSAQDRETFILHALEGFSIDEIAGITSRRPEEVQLAIGRAREKLRRAFPIDNSFKKKLLQETGTH